jgi:hypothetical protein
MEKRVLIAVFLSFLVIYAYQALVPAPPEPRPAGQSPAPGASSAPQAGGGAPATGAAPGTPVGGGEPPAPAAAPVVADSQARRVLENGAVRAVFDARRSPGSGRCGARRTDTRSI